MSLLCERCQFCDSTSTCIFPIWTLVIILLNQIILDILPSQDPQPDHYCQLCFERSCKTGSRATEKETLCMCIFSGGGHYLTATIRSCAHACTVMSSFLVSIIFLISLLVVAVFSRWGLALSPRLGGSGAISAHNSLPGSWGYRHVLMFIFIFW